MGLGEIRVIDVERVRRDTPACEQVVHLNNAGASLPPRVVVDAVVGHLELEARIGGYEAAEEEAVRIGRYAGAAAELIGAAPDEIAFTENATRGWNAIFWSMALGHRWQPGDRVVCSRAEYVSNYLGLLQAQRLLGIEIVVAPTDEAGAIDVDGLGGCIDERTRLVVVTHVPTHGGLVNPAEAVGAACRSAGVPFLLDACQSIGQLRVDVQAIGCDALAVTGRKFLRAPRGTGFLYVNRALAATLEPIGLDFHSADWTAPDRYELRAGATRFEQYETSVASKVGLGVALDYLLDLGIDAVETRVTMLAEGLRDRLRAIAGVVVTDSGHVRSGIVTCRVDGHRPADLKLALRAGGFNTSVSSAPSALLDMQARGLDELLRASVHYYNTDDELDRFAAALARTAHP
jgi:cysteine desulfurase / selenocysteine lyase